MMGAVTQDNARRAFAFTSRRVSRRQLLGAAAIAALLAATIAIVAGRSGGDGSDTVVIGVPGAPTGLVATGDVVWVAAAGSQAVWPIEAATGRQAAAIRTGGSPARLGVGAHSLWIADEARGSIIPVDTTSKRVFAPVDVGSDVTDVDLAAGALWVASSAEGVVRAIEPRADPSRRVPDRVDAHAVDRHTLADLADRLHDLERLRGAQVPAAGI